MSDDRVTTIKREIDILQLMGTRLGAAEGVLDPSAPHLVQKKQLMPMRWQDISEVYTKGGRSNAPGYHWLAIEIPNGQGRGGVRANDYFKVIEAYRLYYSGLDHGRIYEFSTNLLLLEDGYWVSGHVVILGDNPAAGGKDLVRKQNPADNNDREQAFSWAEDVLAKKLLSLVKARHKRLTDLT